MGGKATKELAGDEHLGYTTGEILQIPQLQIQLACIVLLHGLSYYAFSTNKKSYFYSRPNIIAHYVPRASRVRAFDFGALFCRGTLAGPLFFCSAKTSSRSRRFLLSFIWMSSFGTYLWLTDEQLADPNFDRIWGKHEKTEWIVVSMLAIQMYDVPACVELNSSTTLQC